MNNLCINVDIILYILSLCPSHDLSRYRIMASYVLTLNKDRIICVTCTFNLRWSE